MFNFLSSLFDGGTIAKGIDASILTNQEKVQFLIEYNRATSGQNLARRFIALTVTFTYMFFLISGWILSFFNMELSDFVFRVADENLNASFQIVIAFYFGSGMIDRARAK